MIRKQSNMGKEWEIEVKEQNQEPESLKLNTSEKPPNQQTCCVTRASQKKWQVCPFLLWNTAAADNRKYSRGAVLLCVERRGWGRVPSTWRNICFSPHLVFALYVASYAQQLN